MCFFSVQVNVLGKINIRNNTPFKQQFVYIVSLNNTVENKYVVAWQWEKTTMTIFVNMIPVLVVASTPAIITIIILLSPSRKVLFVNLSVCLSP